ncbi:hypothetical protein M405DRAFT_475412 [Rhizopogon salebrosus TDB-379]|nr:hypothetical protein M405DRAFT_475412 [Rhizopogon salebrosus TDB-379]
MVRQTKQTPEERKESHKRKAPQKKKVTESGVWPCGMDGCNKQFAREADLKRHQRTTKLHTVPGYACPQCDATFTRTDALRRHQKSRHNGVVIEPTGGEKKGSSENEPQASGSKSESRSLSPPSNEKEDPLPATVSAPPGGLGGPHGPHSYYRQHTMPAGAYMPPPLGVIVEGQYPPNIGLPTSSARLHQATWPPSAWIPDGSQPPPMGYPHPYYSYYRGMPHPPPPPEIMAQIQNGVQPHSPSPGDDSSRTSSPTMASMHGGSNPHMSHPSSASGTAGRFQGNDARSPVIDPSLDLSPTSASTRQDEETLSLEATQAVVGVAFNSAERESSSAVPDSDSPTHMDPRPGHDFFPSRSPPHTHSYERPPEMEHMLTEDGEPMLNPAELLTQESLASPPPSL